MKKRLISTIVFAGLLTLALAATAPAAGGRWMRDGATWRFTNPDGSYPAQGWQWIDSDGNGLSECYYFTDRSGHIALATMIDTYYVNADGMWEVAGVVQHQTADGRVIGTNQAADEQAASGQSVSGQGSGPYVLKNEWKADQRYTVADPAPWTLEELMRDVDVTDPRSVAAYWLWSVNRMTMDKNEGMKMLKYLFADLEPYGTGFTEGGAFGQAGWDSYFNERLTGPYYYWLPRAFFEGASLENGLDPSRPITVYLHYNAPNTDTVNKQQLESCGRISIVFWVQSHAAGNQVNIHVTRFANSNRWYVTSSASYGGLFYNQMGPITQEQQNLIWSIPNDRSAEVEHQR